MKRNRLRLLTPVLLGVGLICGCKKTDLSTPQAAAEAFAAAAEAGDTDVAKAAGTGADDNAVADFARMVHAGKTLHDASMSTFGEKGGHLPPGYDGRKMPVRALKDATLAIDGDSATLTPKDGGMPRRLKKVDGVWKAEVLDMAPWPMPASMESAAKAMEETTDDIKAGKLKTADEAAQALEAKLRR